MLYTSNHYCVGEKVNAEIMSEEEFQKALKERRKRQANEWCSDGYIKIAEKTIVYRGIPYYFALLRYYTRYDTDTKLNDAGVHAVIEHPDVDPEILQLARDLDMDDFLYHDTLHSGQEHYTIEQHTNVAVKEAEMDINWLLDNGIDAAKNKRREYKTLIARLKKLRDDA